MKRFRRLRRWWPAVLVLFLALLVYAAWPGSSTFTISKETTYITEPIDADGYVDYQTALNQRMSQGITPENNANVLIWQALGPHPEGGTTPPEYFKWLGIESPPEEGEYFIGRDKYFERYLNDKADPQPEQPEDFDEFRAQPDRKKQWQDRVGWANKWPWKRTEQPDIADWLKRNEKPLALAVEASKRPQYFHPLVTKARDRSTGRMLGSLLPTLAKCRELTVALGCRAMARVAEDDFQNAWRDLIACQRLGRLIGHNGTLVETLAGIAILSTATDLQIELLGHRQHSSKHILAWLDDLRMLPAPSPLADKLDFGERFMLLDSLLHIATFGMDRLNAVNGRVHATPPKMNVLEKLFTRNIDFDPSFRKANRAFDQVAAASRISDRTDRKAEFDRILVELSRMDADDKTVEERLFSGKAERGERIGHKVILLMLPAFEKFSNVMDRVEQTQANLQVAFAIAAYRADTGRYPAHLDELAPKYLPRIPGDLYSGKPLIYRPTETGYLLYSIGVNGIDEDGHWMDDEPPGDDLRVRMPVPEPKAK